MLANNFYITRMNAALLIIIFTADKKIYSFTHIKTFCLKIKILICNYIIFKSQNNFIELEYLEYHLLVDSVLGYYPKMVHIEIHESLLV